MFNHCLGSTPDWTLKGPGVDGMGNRGGKVPSGDVETPSLKTLHPPITPPPPTDQPSHSPTWNDGISHQFSNQAGGDSDNCATPAGLLTPPLLATSSVDVQSSPGPGEWWILYLYTFIAFTIIGLSLLRINCHVIPSADNLNDSHIAIVTVNE